MALDHRTYAVAGLGDVKSIVPSSAALDLLHECRNGRRQGCRKPVDIDEAYVPLATLDVADICPMDPSAFREPLLRQSPS
jgi:hypothetical protein